MAIIILEPKEEFEHYHSEKSISELISGQLVYKCEERTVNMKIGEKIFTQPNIPHTIINIGNTLAKFGCSHHHDEL